METILEQVYANIKYEIDCPNLTDCQNDGVYQIAIQRDVIRDEISDEVIGIDWDYDYLECEFCNTNKSSVFNGGTMGLFDATGLIETLTPSDLSTYKIKLDGQSLESFNNLKKMHGKRIAIFKQFKTKQDKNNVTLEYKFIKQGRCIGKYIFNKRGERHIINLNSFLHLYFPIFKLETNYKYQITLNIGDN